MRKKLIELLDDIHQNGNDFKDVEIHGVRIPNTVSNEGVADHLLANGVTVQQWIPVSERLPEKEGQYLIWTTIYFIPDHVDECNHYDGMKIAYYNPDFGFMGHAARNAKAWTYLPKQPKEAE